MNAADIQRLIDDRVLFAPPDKPNP
jgi:hypothetical protein